APWLEVRDLGQVADYQPGRVLSVGGDSVTWKARGVYRRRGWMTFGPTSLRVQEPFGLFSRETRLRERTTVLVYPRVRPIPDLLTSSAQQIGSSPSFGAWADYPPETGGVRDYTTGDSFGRIHWPLSAHHGRLMSKTFEQPLTTDIWILLDLDRKVHFGEGEESTVEYAISLAASMTAQVYSRGRQVGLIANDGRGTFLEPHRALRQDRLIPDYLAIGLEPDPDRRPRRHAVVGADHVPAGLHDREVHRRRLVGGHRRRRRTAGGASRRRAHGRARGHTDPMVLVRRPRPGSGTGHRSRELGAGVPRAAPQRPGRIAADSALDPAH